MQSHNYGVAQLICPCRMMETHVSFGDMCWHCLTSAFLLVAECGKVQERLGRSVTAESRREAACQGDTAYGNGALTASFPALKWLFALSAAATKHLVQITAAVVRNSVWHRVM